MKLVFVIKNRDETPFMLVTSTPQGSTFEPMSEPAKDLAKMLREEYGKTPITKPELVQTMDASKIIEGPSPSGTATQKKVANISLVKKEVNTLPVVSISEVLLSEFSNEEFKNVLTFKASSFISDQTRSSVHFEIKGVRAIWDPSLSIPGTNRRGGFRCPVGTRYGGQITDRFGRSCGWGVARRIANQIADIGERLEQRDDDKRKRRLDRRNARMMRRLGGVPETGRVEGGLRGIAERLEGGDAPKPRVGRGEVAETGEIDDGWRNVARGLVGRRRVPKRRVPEILPEAESSARVPKNRRRDVIPETAPTPKAPKKNLREEKEDREFLQRVLEAHPDGESGPVWDDWVGVTTEDEPIIKRLVKKGFLRKQKNDTARAFGPSDPDRAKFHLQVTTAGKAFLNGKKNPAPKPRPAKRPAPAGKRPQARPRVAPQPENVDVLTARDASDALASEDFKPYVLRKYDEYAKRVREIREGGGNAGMLTRREWYEINKDNLRDAWKNVHGRSAPQDFEPPTPKPRRPRNNRGRRRQATAQGAGRSATRKPTPDDVPEPATKKPVRPTARKVWADRTDVKASREAVANAIREIKSDPNHVWGETFDKQVKAILLQPKAVTEPELKELIGLVAGVEDDMRGQIKLGRQLGQPPDTDAVASLRKVSEQHRKLRQAINAKSTTSKAPTPTPSSPKSGNTPELKMNNLADNHETAMPKLQPKDNKFVSVPVGNKGINDEDDARAYKGSLADVPDEFILAALEARTANAYSRQGFSKEIKDAVLKVFPNLSDAEIKAKLEKLTVDVRRGIGTDVQAGLGALNGQRIAENVALIKSLKENGVDFVQMPVGSGITSPQYFLLLDENPQKWGRGYFLKFGDEDFDDAYNDGNSGSQHAEIVGNILAKQLGFANGSPRIAGGDDAGPFLLMDIFLNNADGKLAGGYDPSKITDPQSRLFNGILNAVMDVRDRHGGNGDLFAGNGAVPLDFGRAKFERKTAEELVNYFPSVHGMDPRPWQGYKRRLSGLQGQDKIRETEAIRKELKETIATAQQKIRDSFKQLDEVDSAYDAINDTTKTERRENLEYNLNQLGEPKFIEGLMTAILRP